MRGRFDILKRKMPSKGCGSCRAFGLLPRGDVCGVGVGDGWRWRCGRVAGLGACGEPRSPSFGSQGSSGQCWW